MSERSSENRVEKRTQANSPSIDLPDIQGSPRWAVIGIFFILLFGALYLAASFVLPVIIALLFTLVLSPVVRFMRRRLRIWEPVSAFVLVIGALMTLISGFYMLSDPITEIVNNAPRYVEAVDNEMRSVRDRLDRLREAQERAETSAEAENPAPGDDEPDEVVVKNPDLIDSATTALPEIAASVVFSLIFLFFLLASGDLFYQKLIKSMPTLSDKKRALHIAHDIERELSRYLFTITMINICLGIAVGSALWWVGMPTPVIFGALATLLNFIPYIGSLLGIALVGVIALAELGDLAAALAPVLLYLACTTLEGQFITPMIVGRRLEMNAAAVFLSVAFWGWIWGVVGMFLAVPVMVAIKVFASYIEPLGPFGDFLSVENKPVAADEDDDD